MKGVCRLMGGKGNIVVMMGDLSNQAARQRTKDVEDVIATPACKGIKIVEKQTAKWSRTEGRDLVMNWLSAGVKFDAVVPNNDEMALGAVKAIQAAGLKNVVVVGFDATADAVAAVKAGTLAATVQQQPELIGQYGVQTAKKLIAGQPVDKFIPVPLNLVK